MKNEKKINPKLIFHIPEKRDWIKTLNIDPKRKQYPVSLYDWERFLVIVN